MNSKIAIIFIVIVVIVIGAIFAFFPKKRVTKNPPSTTESIETELPSATGKVDDLVKATLSEISDEQQFIEEKENDGSLINLDEQEISSFGQTINESEF